MKTYQDEKNFVENFAKDCKQGIKENGNFEAEVNNINVIVTAMDNNNSSKVTIYTGTVNGVEFSGSITALKKKLNITYTKEYSRSAEGTKVVIKSDDELSKTAETAAKRIKDAVEVLYKASQRYGLSRAEMLEHTENVEALILESLKQQRDKVAKEKADREAKQAQEAKKKAEEAAKKIEAEKAKLEKQLKELQAKLAKMQ